MATTRPLAPDGLRPILDDAGLAAGDLSAVGADGASLGGPATGPLLAGPMPAGDGPEPACTTLRERHAASLPADAAVLVHLAGGRSDAELAEWRNALWPWLHVVALYRVGDGRAVRETLQGREALAGSVPGSGVVLYARARAHVMSPEATVEKFDHNAAGWDVRADTPGHRHFRWMRRYVGRFGGAPRDGRILDFGCGAGWVGIEAALAAGGATLCAFDPSPAMVANAGANARASGIDDFVGRTGFGEDPPFPAPGEEPFDLVVSSGVVSFSPALDRWTAGLARAVKPGGTLVVGDLNPGSRGMRWRRGNKPLLPAREMNAQTAGAMRARLEELGFTHEATAGYQLTRPVPQLMHLSDTRTGGLLTWPFLLLNRALPGKLGSAHYDSWVSRYRAPR